jgi:hypothetical protein
VALATTIPAASLLGLILGATGTTAIRPLVEGKIAAEQRSCEAVERGGSPPRAFPVLSARDLRPARLRSAPEVNRPNFIFPSRYPVVVKAVWCARNEKNEI